jgi:hypothetical protein
MQTIWGIHMEWDDGATAPNAKDIAIGWHEIGDLRRLHASRDAYKAAFTKTSPRKKRERFPLRRAFFFGFAGRSRFVYPDPTG